MLWQLLISKRSLLCTHFHFFLSFFLSSVFLSKSSVFKYNLNFVYYKFNLQCSRKVIIIHSFGGVHVPCFISMPFTAGNAGLSCCVHVTSLEL